MPVPELKETSLPPEELLLDPNNFRFQDSEGFVYADEGRFHEDSFRPVRSSVFGAVIRS